MRRERSSTHPGAGQPRPRRRIHDEAPAAGEKLPENAVCPRCRASYRRGRWTWKSAPADAYEHVCPACERIQARYPAGELRIAGDFSEEHRNELVGLLRNLEARESRDHPLKRIMDVSRDTGGFVVTTTDAKLVETFGRALQKAYAGRLEHPATTSDKGNLVRIHWFRD